MEPSTASQIEVLPRNELMFAAPDIGRGTEAPRPAAGDVVLHGIDPQAPVWETDIQVAPAETATPCNAIVQVGGTLAPLESITKWAWNRNPYTDVGNATRLVNLCGTRLRYCGAWKRWLVWDGQRWAIDDTGRVTEVAKLTLRAMRKMIPLTDAKYQKAYKAHVRSSESWGRLNAMIGLARTAPPIPVTASQLDADPWKLNCLNRTLDLRSGRLSKHQREDLLTKLVPVEYDPNAECRTFDAFLGRIMKGNAALIEYLQRIVGYCLTGDVGEKALFILYGEGNNGKTTFLETIRHVLGDYAGQVPIQSLMKKKFGDDGIPNDIAQLQGKRFVTSSETDAGQELAVAKIKQLTGLATLQARYLYAEFFEFVPTFKLFMDCNHKPVIRGHDPAIWNRLKFLPFTVTIPNAEIDREMGAKLRAEAPGILAWAVRGCLEWQRRGLDEPQEVREATQTHQQEMDTIGRFIAECCELAPEFREVTAKLYSAYETWCHDAGEEPESKKAFGMALKRTAGLEPAKDRTIGRFWQGINLRPMPTKTDEKHVGE